MHLKAIGGAILLGCVAQGLQPRGLDAQYFGRQKVQYDRFDWRTMITPKFRIYFYPSEEVPTRDAARMAERWYVRHSNSFQLEFDHKPLILYADAPDFQQTNVVSGQIGEGTGGVTEALRTRVIMPFTGVYADNDHVLGHELVHVFQYTSAMTGPEARGLSGMSRLPLWLVEGMAEYLSLGRNDPLTAMWMRDAALRGELPTIAQLGRDTRFFPYRYGQALLAYVGGRWGDRAVVELFRAATRTGVEGGLNQVLGVSSQELSQDWITAVRSAYLPVIEGRQRPRDAGDPLIVDDEAGAMNLAPSVSPDGRYVAYFGRHSLFTIDLLLADARTGRLIRKLTSPTTDEHYDALSFISSVGAWSPDSRQFAFVVFEDGENSIDVIDVTTARVQRTYRPAGLGAIQHLAWSPDGNAIAFSGMTGGISDLYLLNVTDGSVRRLTNDRYADLQPVWSADGHIVFVTDRATGTGFDDLCYGKMGLASLNIGDGAIRPIPVFDGANHIDPHYSRDGRSLFFISDRDGFSDIYRLDLESRDVFQVTRIATGVSGITALSPAFSISSSDGRLVFSAFENSGNNIYALDEARTMGEPVLAVTPAAAAAAAVLPPLAAEGGGLVQEYLADPLRGLPESGDYPVESYSARLGLDYLGPPSIGVGFGGTYGTLIGGSASAYFGDMLGNRFLAVALTASGTVKDLGGQVVYQNLRRRINWGVGAAHIPYLTGFTLVGATTVNGTPVTQVDQYLYRIYIDQVQLFGQYPLSVTRRFEASGGYTRYGFGAEIDRYLVDAFGQVVAQARVDTTAPSPLHFFQASLAYVTDNSYFGFTSPIVGSRSRFEVSPSFGTLTFYSALGDYRRYARVALLSFAGRVLHYGRYGRDASGISSRGERVLAPLFLGDPYLIRGYTSGSFTGAECKSAPGTNDCPAFDRLIGSRLAVANFEIRIPLIGNEQLGLVNMPFLPVEIAPFLDAGLAWSSGDSVKLEIVRNTPLRVPVFSTGVSSRFNLFGYLVLEVYYAYPFQRPDKGAHFGLQINPGW